MFAFNQAQYKKFEAFRKKKPLETRCAGLDVGVSKIVRGVLGKRVAQATTNFEAIVQSSPEQVKAVQHFTLFKLKKLNVWYYHVKDNFLNIDANIVKGITMAKRTDYNECRVLIHKSCLDDFIQTVGSVDLLYIYCESGNYYNCSFYSRNTKGAHIVFFNKLVAFNGQHPELDGAVKIIYTNLISQINADPEVQQDVLLRLLYMKTTASNDPYPDTVDNYLRHVFLKIQYAISRNTGIKIDGSKFSFEGPLSNILSERGLITVANKSIHDTKYQANTISSAIYFNMPSETNLNNKHLSIQL
jgi:hypothetical protein